MSAAFLNREFTTLEEKCTTDEMYSVVSSYFIYTYMYSLKCSFTNEKQTKTNIMSAAGAFSAFVKNFSGI